MPAATCYFAWGCFRYFGSAHVGSAASNLSPLARLLPDLHAPFVYGKPLALEADEAAPVPREVLAMREQAGWLSRKAAYCAGWRATRYVAKGRREEGLRKDYREDHHAGQCPQQTGHPRHPLRRRQTGPA